MSLEARLKGTIFWISKETQRNTKTTHTRFQPFCYKTKKQTRVDMRYTRAQNRVPMFLWKHTSFRPAGYDKKETAARSYGSFVQIPSRFYVFASKMGNRNAFPVFSIHAMEKHSNVSRKPVFLVCKCSSLPSFYLNSIDSERGASHQAKRNFFQGLRVARPARRVSSAR